MRKLLVRLVLLLVALAIATGVWIIAQTPKPLTITITFTGYTNDALFGDRRVLFVVTNHNDVAVKRWHVWLIEGKDGAPPVDAFYAVEGGLPIPRPTTAFLAARQSETMSLPIPTNQLPWRALVQFSPDGWKYRYSMWRAGNSKTSDLANQLHVPYADLPVQVFASDWIDK